VNVPELLALTDGRFEAMCDRCTRRSAAVAATTPADAWDEMLKLGWSSYEPIVVPRQGGASGRHAVCASCTAYPETIEDAVRAARKARHRRSARVILG
jgi:hypothetical protein